MGTYRTRNESGALVRSSDETAKPEPESIRHADEPVCVHWTGPDVRSHQTPLAKLPLRIGRELSNDIVLDGKEVSRQHAEIRHDKSGLQIVDLGSSNHLRVNGRVVESAVLQQGMVLRVGEWVGVVTRGSETFREVEATGLWGSSAIHHAMVDVRLAARQPLNIVVLGETGTGKELVARAVSEWSGLSKNFVPVNCAALSESLLDAELFGHRRGAFTGAINDGLGYVRAADGGMLFLDEIGELSLAGQAKLLRVIEQSEVTPVGTTAPVRVELRVIAATHRNLRDMVREGSFREDLLNRLEGLVVRVPPLRARREDILPLFHSFVRERMGNRHAPLSPELAEALALHAWPGNVRELRQVAVRMVATRSGRSTWRPRDVQLSASIEPSAKAEDCQSTPEEKSRPLNREEVVDAILAHGNVVAAARALGRSKQTVYSFARVHGIDIDAIRVQSKKK